MKKENSQSIISEIDIKGMWKTNDVHWDNLDSSVNILVGTNGSGKSTFLRIINNAVCGNTKEISKQIDSAEIRLGSGEKIEYARKKKEIELLSFSRIEADYINIFDTPVTTKSGKSSLFHALDSIIYQRLKDVKSFTDYRMKILNPENDLQEIKRRIELLFSVIDRFFEISGKRIGITGDNKIIFRFSDNDNVIEPDHFRPEKSIF